MNGNLSAVSAGAIRSDYEFALESTLWAICGLVTIFFVSLLFNVKRNWTSARRIPTERAERACDTVLNISIALIATTLTVLPILGGKVVGRSYLIPVGFALTYFLALLVFTIHLRFNFLWRMGESFEVNANKNLRFAFWLTVATSSLVLGIVLLLILAMALAKGWMRIR